MIALAYTTHAQRPRLQLDHVALYVQNVEKSAAFYHDILGLDTIPTPFPGLPVKWFAIGGDRQLHLIQGAKEIHTPHVLQHLAFSVDSIEQLINRLTSAGITFYDANGKAATIQFRGDGVTQFFIKDPDNNWIEFNNRKH